MYVGKTLFAQLMEFVPWTSFGRTVDRYGGNAGVRRMTCAEQFRVMAFAQLTWRESLRDIEVTLAAYPRANWTPSPRQTGPTPSFGQQQSRMNNRRKKRIISMRAPHLA